MYSALRRVDAGVNSTCAFCALGVWGAAHALSNEIRRTKSTGKVNVEANAEVLIAVDVYYGHGLTDEERPRFVRSAEGPTASI